MYYVIIKPGQLYNLLNSEEIKIIKIFDKINFIICENYIKSEFIESIKEVPKALESAWID